MARTMTTPTGRVALSGSSPVEVLMKSAPAIMQTRLAIPTLRRVASSLVARMVFMWASPQAARKARTSSYRACQLPVSTWAREMTMSISLAPAVIGAASGQGSGATFDGATIDVYFAHPVQVQGYARVAYEVRSSVGRNKLRLHVFRSGSSFRGGHVLCSLSRYMEVTEQPVTGRPQESPP